MKTQSPIVGRKTGGTSPVANNKNAQAVPTIADILKGSEYALTIFPKKAIDSLELFLKGMALNLAVDSKS
ncbi:MAG: hypothetical protein HY748_12070 [Elusimicrobia bacterium]|nr:hypothetical protein [Elusimicrobiota bacterium]